MPGKIVGGSVSYEGDAPPLYTPTGGGKGGKTSPFIVIIVIVFILFGAPYLLSRGKFWNWWELVEYRQSHGPVDIEK